MKELCKVHWENRVQRDHSPRATWDACGKGRVLRGKNFVSLIVFPMVFGILSAQKVFLHYPNAIFEVLARMLD